MQHWIAFLFLILFSNLVNAQSIYTALHLNQKREYKTAKPIKIVETNTFSIPGGKKVERNFKSFDEAGMLLMEERFEENGNLTARLTYTSDTTKKLTLTRTMERWTQFGYSKETAFYSYNSSDFLIGTTDKDANGNLLFQTDLVCNEKGDPVELTLLDNKGNITGKETATYFYDRNRAITTVFSNTGKLLSSDSIKIRFQTAYLFPEESEIYNSQGDIINSTRKNLNGTETIFEYEYTYDTWGNCTEDKIYKVTLKKNGKRKREIDRIFKKEYTYKKSPAP